MDEEGKRQKLCGSKERKRERERERGGGGLRK
jgi:hypothetical protein